MTIIITARFKVKPKEASRGKKGDTGHRERDVQAYPEGIRSGMFGENPSLKMRSYLYNSMNQLYI